MIIFMVSLFYGNNNNIKCCYFSTLEKALQYVYMEDFSKNFIHKKNGPQLVNDHFDINTIRTRFQVNGNIQVLFEDTSGVEYGHVLTFLPVTFNGNLEEYLEIRPLRLDTILPMQDRGS